MKHFLSAVTVFAVALSLAAPAGAADEKKKKKDARKGPDAAALFAKLDTNKDQKLSKEEFAAFRGLKEPKKEKEPKGLSTARDEWFKKLDTNGDGFLTSAEFGKIKDVIAANPVAKKKKAQ